MSKTLAATAGWIRTAGMGVAAAGMLIVGACSASPSSAQGSTPAAGAVLAHSIQPIAATLPTTPPPTGQTGPGLITAQGTGIITGTPDLITISLGVQTRSPSANTALEDNNTRANAVIDMLKKSGVAPADLQTSQLSINPDYDQNGQRITGYVVSNMLTAKVRKIATAGQLIDAVSKVAGDAVRVEQLSFSIDNDSALRAKARAEAVRQAQAQAKQLADAAGVHLGAVRSIVEDPSSESLPYIGDKSAVAASGAAVPIQTGSQQLTVVVQVVYEITP